MHIFLENQTSQTRNKTIHFMKHDIIHNPNTFESVL